MKKIPPTGLKTETLGQGCIEGKSRLCHAIFLIPYLFRSLSLNKKEGKKYKYRWTVLKWDWTFPCE